jgi:predicted secreted protein
MSNVDHDKLAKRFGVKRGGSPSTVDHAKLAENLGVKQSHKVSEARAGYFGASQLAAEIRERFKTPSSGGRPTDPDWRERRLIPLTSVTLKRLEDLATQLRAQGISIEPMQLAALLLERAALHTNEDVLGEIILK